ncbi:uncharacterized protein LOC114856156 [Betta splendens]|uniref:Uncharacterized protein LOC114856156 n=1 Tax=Betta splendens TaxID=158456 RepID=A0A6P7MMP7_BETSP|nr:uncharacterized protein LOC114856156 [Betta splendens]
MDDLDHSIQIAEYDWTCFCEESEECTLPKPSLACHDSSGLSDSEDSEISSPVQLHKSRTGGEEDEKSLMQLDSDVCRVCSAGNVLNTTEVHAQAAEEAKATDNSTALSNKLEKEVDNSRNGPDSPFTRSSKPEKCFEKVKHDSEGGSNMRGFEQSKQTLFPKSGDAPSSKTNHELQQMWCKDKTMSEMLLMTDSLIEDVAEPTMGRNTHQPGNVSRHAFGLNDPSQTEAPEPEELDFHSLSAAESAEEPLPRHKDHVTESQELLLLATSHSPNTNDAQDRGLYYCDSSLSCNAAATRCEGYEGAGAEPTPLPSADHGANERPDDSSHSPTLRDQEIRPSASGGSTGPQLRPDLTATPCPAAGSSAARAEAAGLTGPVYAMSAFWDEMEKLTINDILLLRMGGTAPRDPTQDPGTPGARGLTVSHTFLADGFECTSSDGPTDTSDIADSDYFTQPDESKPDCSSCELSTSDLEEEYWQNPSPDPLDNNHPRTSGSPFLCRGELWCTWSPVPSEDCAGQRLDHGESHALVTKTTAEQNVQAPNTEELRSQPSLGDNESSPVLSPRPVTMIQNSLEPVTPTPVLSSTDKHYQISIPELFEHFFTEGGAEDGARGTVYDPEDISATPVLDGTFKDEMPFSALHDSQEPTFSFPRSHATTTTLTFPKPNHLFLNAHSEDGDISPVRVPPPSFTQADDAKAAGSRTWQTLLSIKRICFHSTGGTWCRRSGAWVFPVDAEKASEKRKEPPDTAVAAGRVRWTIWETLHTRQEGVLSTLKQSDMCLVCIAFASWVLRSSNPEAADAWKAALLANVSALSAIQFLRQYVKKTPLQDDP